MIRKAFYSWVSLFCFLVTAPLLSGQSAPPAPSIPHGTNLSDPQALLPLALSANSLDDPKLMPWHLKASFETFDEKGQSADRGTYEEWHLASGKSKRIYTSAHYNQTEYENAEGVYYETPTGAAPWPLSLIGRELVHPMPDKIDTGGSTPELRPFSATKSIKLNCLMLSQPLKKIQWPLGLFPTYCFNAGSTMLRFELFYGGIESVRNQMATFRGIYVAKDISLSDNTKPLLHIQLASLSSMAESEAAAIGALPEFVKIAPPKQLDVSTAVMTGKKIGGRNPAYPEQAKENHVQGKVIMKAVIGTDGRIHQLRVVSSSDEMLSISAVSAVGTWVYTPYLFQGKPVSVQTQITVIYTLGG
jgi:TonB family protein